MMDNKYIIAIVAAIVAYFYMDDIKKMLSGYSKPAAPVATQAASAPVDELYPATEDAAVPAM